MIYDFYCKSCGNKFEEIVSMVDTTAVCPKCEALADKQFQATGDIHIPASFMTMRSDVFTDEEWQAMKKDPNIVRAK